ncbi:cyclase family protein [Christensenella intestinihominis]|uniref:cyclase family protein n=1 Tax=Christensenella intestinihominis TaxID=1851429 RepID=UPI00082EEDE3|nr:cyclase family protein [Christensenella intestinihominis]
MNKKYVVDLSQQMRPGEEVNFPFEIDLKDATESMPELEHDADSWYKIGYVNMCTHNGTHVEVPYHHLKDGMDLAEFPLHQMIGNMVLMDFSYKKIGEEITTEEVRAYDDKIHEGDIVFIKTGMDSLFRTKDWVKYPYVALEAVHYLIDKKIGCLGTDAAGIENNDIPNQPAHVSLFQAKIPLVESLTNLDAVKKGNYMVFILPLPIVHGDASPVRVTAIEKKGLL